MRKQHGITDVLLHLPMNLHRYGYHSVYYILISARGTPLEVLHTLLLGPYKYLLRATMAKLSKKQCTQLSALLSAFPSSGFTSRISRNIAKYFKSFVGRDFKALAQMALFVLSSFLAPAEIEVWLALSKVST